MIENYYVCLDYRSEFASFYAHIDEPRPTTAVRLHFFSNRLRPSDLTNLKAKQRASYLGYVVCRRGNVALVGRTMIKVPRYVEIATSVVEPVHFLGQVLHVQAVPFMQQDRRFAVCAHVAVWMIHYAAFRRGMAERRLVADVVETSAPARSLRPRSSAGLTPEEVSAAFSELGFRPLEILTPTFGSSASQLPRLQGMELPTDVLLRVREALGADNVEEDSPNLTKVIESSFEDLVREVEASGELAADPAAGPLVALSKFQDYLLGALVGSRIPVYLGTSNHALVLVGRSGGLDPMLFVHDDQRGPYLAAPSLVTLSEDALLAQSGAPPQAVRDSANEVPPVDRLLEMSREDLIGEDTDRAVQTMIVPAPARCLLFPWNAVGHALDMIRALQPELLEAALLEPGDEELEAFEGTSVRTRILMGIDYKQTRRLQSIQSADFAGRELFSSVNLAEWVVLVEGVNPKDEVVWECVYDASSSDTAPRLQLGRVLRAVVFEVPGPQRRTEAVLLVKWAYPPVEVPTRVGKVV